MSDKSFEWQNELQEVVHSPDVSGRVAHLRDTLTTRLRIMTRQIMMSVSQSNAHCPCSERQDRKSRNEGELVFPQVG
jgi:hypothetical protein